MIAVNGNYVYEMSNFVNDFFLTYSYYLGIIIKQSIVVKKKGGENMHIETKNEILFAIGMIGQKVDNIQEDINEMKEQVAKIPKIEKELKEQKEEIRSIKERLTSLEEESKITNERLTFLEEESRSISRSVTFIENDHGDKLKALFDAFTMTTEKSEEQEKKNNLFENKLEKHDAEIYYLNTKVQGL